jgi:hypothetical protein
MATQPIETVSTDPQHFYNAEAYVLSADLQQPVPAVIKNTAVTLPDDGQYTFDQSTPYQLFGVLSYRSGYAQVSGHEDARHNGFRTLTTAAIEDLNVLDVVTADRVVGQISTVHHYDGQVPSVTFLGTRFVNLRIGGHKVDIDQDIHILGARSADDRSYLDDPDVLARMSKQYSRIRESENLPDWAAEQFRWDKAAANLPGQASCSLVNRINGAPGVCFGHVIDLPHFGKIYLGELCVERTPAPDPTQDETYHFRLTMIRLEMGCIGTGKAKIIALDANGGGGVGSGGH